MGCRNCPYGKEDFERRMAWYNKIVEEEGIPNDIYGYETYEDAVEDAEQFLWCDKVGGKVYCFGYCEDAYSDIPKHENRSKRKRRNKRERDLNHKNHIKFLAQTYPGYPPPAMPVNKNGFWNFDDPVGTIYYKKIYRGNHKGNRYTYFKKHSNRCVRRYKEELHKGGSYKKVFDYWWTVN